MLYSPTHAFLRQGRMINDKQLSCEGNTNISFELALLVSVAPLEISVAPTLRFSFVGDSCLFSYLELCF